MTRGFRETFSSNKPVIGMIHLAGTGQTEKVKVALEELKIYEEEGLDGAIVEDYHGYLEDVVETLKQASHEKFKIVLGLNLLREPYSSFHLANEYGLKFIQFDSVQTQDLDLDCYLTSRNKYLDISVLGGVGFKYTRATGNPLEQDLKEARDFCEAIVTTGTGTGIETPLEKLNLFKNRLSDFPLIIGAGVNANNAYNQLSVADGAIVGSYFKQDGNTRNRVDRNNVRTLMDIVKKVRTESAFSFDNARF